jgi:hypothetical protein
MNDIGYTNYINTSNLERISYFIGKSNYAYTRYDGRELCN